MTAGGADDIDHDTGAALSGDDALAHGLLLEAVDCMTQAVELVADPATAALLSRQATALSALASRLAAGG